MKKRIFSLITMILLFTTITSCYFNPTASTYFEVKPLTYNYTNQDENRLTKLKSDIETSISKGDNYESFSALYEQFEKEYNYIDACLTAASIKMDINYNQYLDYEKLYDYISEVSKWHDDILIKIYSSPYKEQFFSGYTEKEINQIINFPKQEYYLLTDKIDTLNEEYYSLNEDNFYIKAPLIYAQLVENQNKLAKLFGYNNYMEYAFDNIYYRSYPVSEAKQFISYISTYLADVYTPLINNYKSSEAKLDFKGFTEASNILENSVLDNRLLLTSYAQEVGGTYQTAHDHLWSDGYLFITDSKNAYSGAYQTYLYDINEPVLFLGPDYQSTLTYIHEFGHYFAATNSPTDIDDFDLAETNSTTNEFLFVNFLKNSDWISSSAVSHIETYQKLITVDTILSAALIFEFEEKIYSSNNITPSTYDTIIVELSKKYFKDVLEEDLDYIYEYWRAVCIESPCYYLSYAIASIEALNIFYRGTYEQYEKLCTVTGEKTYLELLEELNLDSPLNSETIKYLQTQLLT